MSHTRIPHWLRQLVFGRASRTCEYCRLYEGDTYVRCHIDHIIAEKHGGPTTADNLAVACAYCNLNKGSDIAALDAGVPTRLYNPRVDRWADHFLVVGLEVRGLTAIGRATVRLLRMNDDARREEREALVADGRYPRLHDPPD